VDRCRRRRPSTPGTSPRARARRGHGVHQHPLTHLGRGFIVPQSTLRRGRLRGGRRVVLRLHDRDGEQAGQPYRAGPGVMKPPCTGRRGSRLPWVSAAAKTGACGQVRHLYARQSGRAPGRGPPTRGSGRVTRPCSLFGGGTRVHAGRATWPTLAAQGLRVLGRGAMTGPGRGSPGTAAQLPAGSEVFTRDRLGNLIRVGWRLE